MILSAEKQIYDTANKPNEKAAKTATDYITNTGNSGIEITGNNASSKVQIGNTVKVIADTTHFAEMTSSQFKIHAGNELLPVAYMGTNDAAFAGDGQGHYLVKVFEYTPSGYTTGGALELFNIDGKGRVRLDAFGDYGSARFFNADGNYMVDIGTATDGSYGALRLYQTTDVITDGYFAGIALGKVLASSFVNSGTPALMIYGNPTAYGDGVATDLTAAYGGGAAYIRASSNFRGYVAHGKTIAHRLTFDFDTINGYNYLRFWIDGTEVYRLQQQSYSDRHVKTDIEPIKDGYKNAVASVPIRQFRYDFDDPVRQGANGVMFGIIAQDLIDELIDKKINPEKTPLIADVFNDDESLYSVDYVQFLIARLAYDEDCIAGLGERIEVLEQGITT